MNFWEFLDNNGAGLAVFVLLVLIWGIPSIIDALRKD
jgi:hypothetical protein